MRWRSYWYRHNFKVLVDLAQAALAGLLALVIAYFPIWMDGDVSLREVGRGFENTQQFFDLVSETVHEKIESDRNRELFERNGTFDPDKLIDIRQYQSGVLDEANFNMAITYRIGDLIAFGKSGAASMKNALDDLPDGKVAGNTVDTLEKDADELETILPVSGVSLKDATAVSSNPGAVLAELYRALSETSQDVAGRYERYQQETEGERSSLAPSNVAYYVENTATRQYYTNLPATSRQAAVAAVNENDSLTYLFDGERRFNIMVADPEHELGELCSEYFMQESFLGNGEKVVIAADLSFPVGDKIGRAYSRYLQRVPIFYLTVFAIALLSILLLILLFISINANGRFFRGDKVHLMPFDQVPTEIAAGICVIGMIFWWMLGNRLIAAWRLSPKRFAAVTFVHAAVLYEIALLALHSLLRRIYGGNFWENSVVYYVVMGARAVYSARRSSRRILIVYVGFIVLNLLALVIGGVPGFTMALVMDLTALLYIMRDTVGNQNIREGLKQLSKGKLDYRINTGVLTGESRETGLAVNEMGEGLEKAVESMLASERLKAELITNVSHDLKTPLTSIVSYVDLLKRRNIEDEQAREYIEVLDSKTQRLRQLTEDLVEVSKISSGNIELHPDRIELRQFIAQAGGEFEDRLAERGITISYELGSEPVIIFADGARLWRIFENLLNNVYKYGKADTPISITLTCEDRPENEGPDGAEGVRSAVMIFRNLSERRITASASQLKERFGRGDESRRTEGFGLGLSIADSLAQAMGGSFDVTVDETTFTAWLCFPVCSERQETSDEIRKKE